MRCPESSVAERVVADLDLFLARTRSLTKLTTMLMSAVQGHSGVCSISDSEWASYRLQRMQGADEIDEVLQAHKKSVAHCSTRERSPARRKASGRDFKWGKCPMHARVLQPNAWKGQAYLLCSAWWGGSLLLLPRWLETPSFDRCRIFISPCRCGSHVVGGTEALKPRL